MLNSSKLNWLVEMSIMRPGVKLAGYIRVSRVGGRAGDGYISPDLQRQAISDYASEISGDVAQWFTDEDFSGGTLERPAFQEALALIRAGKLDGIVVMKIDRFARSVADGATVIRELVEDGNVFASCQERINPSTPEGKYMLTSFLANAELFLDQSKASWRAAKSRAVQRGAPMGPTPFGYLRVKSPAVKDNQVSPARAAEIVGHEPPIGTVIPDPVTGPIVSEIFDRAAAQTPPAEIAKWVNSRLGTRYDGPQIRRWLKNRFYLGEIHYGEMSAVGSHAPLTDPATWQAAQPGAARPMRSAKSLPLVGLLKCDHCGATLTGNRFGGSNHDRPIYRCGGRCGKGAVISASIVEAFVYDIAREAMAGFKLSGARADVEDLDAAVRVAESELDAFLENTTIRSELGSEKWETGMVARSKALKDARAARDAAISSDALLSVDLADPTDQDLRSFAFAVIDAVYVARGRGTDRLRVAWSGDDGEAQS
jgi:DNA invertase Pin-like site-specific DNA recombinase